MDNINPSADSQQQNLLDDFSDSQIEYVYATTGQRFVNLLIDNLLMNYGLSYATGALLGIVLASIAPDWLNSIAYDRLSLFAFSWLLGSINYLLYYSLCEKLFRGYTLGKLISGTRAIRQDGKELTTKDAFLRSAIRLVPFEVFSGFSTLTWHDKWSDTMVVKAR